MKKILLAAVAGMLLVACNNVKQFEAPIAALTTQWEASTAQVTDFATLLTQEVTNTQTMANGLEVGEDVLAKLDDTKKAKLAELKGLFQQESAQLGTINDEVNTFVQSWGEKTEMLTGLKDGLASGKLGKDAQATITELGTAATDAGTQVANWTGLLDTAKAKMADIIKQHTAALGGDGGSLMGG